MNKIDEIALRVAGVNMINKNSQAELIDFAHALLDRPADKFNSMRPHMIIVPVEIICMQKKKYPATCLITYSRELFVISCFSQ